jgi:hypothetical protein
MPDLAVSAIAVGDVSRGQDLGAAEPALASSCNGVRDIPAGVGGVAPFQVAAIRRRSAAHAPHTACAPAPPSERS